MIDKKGRIFGVVSLIDLFAVVIIASVIAVVYFNVGASGRPVVGAEQPVYITFFSPALEDFTVAALAENTPVIDDINGTFLGTVVGIEIGDSITFMPDIHGNEVASTMEGFYSVAITSRVYGGLSGGAVVLGGNVYTVGAEVIIWAGRAKTMLNISDIRVEE
ncbi:MAG: DUF4330 domain-containing protein [Defluviitaleaceae bacterium]|nr:DUF4330 domain-containing protein [Defluviitaleaceae bacterium]